MYEPKKNKNYPKSGPDPGHLNIMNCSPDKLIGFALGRHPAGMIMAQIRLIGTDHPIGIIP